jgi:hypothetical protein
MFNVITTSIQKANLTKTEIEFINSIFYIDVDQSVTEITFL